MQSILANPAQVATHLALSALFAYQAQNSRFPTPGSEEDLVTLNAWIYETLGKAGWKRENTAEEAGIVNEAATGPGELTFEQHLANALGEM